MAFACFLTENAFLLSKNELRTQTQPNETQANCELLVTNCRFLQRRSLYYGCQCAIALEFTLDGICGFDIAIPQSAIQ